MEWHFDDNMPIYTQLVYQIKFAIVSGVKTWLNGEPMVDINDELIGSKSGRIMLQIHDGNIQPPQKGLKSISVQRSQTKTIPSQAGLTLMKAMLRITKRFPLPFHKTSVMTGISQTL